MVSTTTIRKRAHGAQHYLARPQGTSGQVLGDAAGALAAQVVAQVQLPGQMAEGALPRGDLGPPFGHLPGQLVYLVLDRGDGGINKGAHDRSGDKDDDEYGQRAPHAVPGEKRDGRLEADGDEKGQEDEHKSAADGVNGGTQGQGQQDAHRGHKADNERVLPVERLPQPAHRPLAGALFGGAAAAGSSVGQYAALPARL